MEQGKIRSEFQRMGENLKELLNAAWESEERKKIQVEVEEGLNDLGQTLNDLLTQVQESELTKKVVESTEQIGESIRSGEAEAKLHEGLLAALQTVNAELEKVAEKYFHSRPDDE